MTPKEKALNLLSKFYYSKDEDGFHSMNKYRAKQCALIAVDEILDASLYYFDELSPYVIYWQKVKQEIQLL
jgi:hypothetical protein